MTEDTGFEPSPEEPPAEPAADAEPAPDVEPAEDEAPAEEPAEDATAAPEQPADPAWLTDLRTQVPGSTLLEFAEDVHSRLRNLGG